MSWSGDQLLKEEALLAGEEHVMMNSAYWMSVASHALFPPNVHIYKKHHPTSGEHLQTGPIVLLLSATRGNAPTVDCSVGEEWAGSASPLTCGLPILVRVKD